MIWHLFAFRCWQVWTQLRGGKYHDCFPRIVTFHTCKSEQSKLETFKEMFPGVNYQQIQDTLTEAQCDLGGAVNRLLATAGAGILCLFHCKYESYIWKSMSIGKCILGGKSHANLTNQHIYIYFYDDELHLKLSQKLGKHNRQKVLYRQKVLSPWITGKSDKVVET